MRCTRSFTATEETISRYRPSEPERVRAVGLPALSIAEITTPATTDPDMLSRTTP